MNEIVSLTDLMPTVLDLGGSEIPFSVHGTSMMPILAGNSKGKDFTVTSWPLYTPGETTRSVDELERGVKEPLSSTITSKDWALIYTAQGYASELYHLPSDPKQQRNVVDQNLEVAKELHGKFVLQLKENGTNEHWLKPRLLIYFYS